MNERGGEGAVRCVWYEAVAVGAGVVWGEMKSWLASE